MVFVNLKTCWVYGLLLQMGNSLVDAKEREVEVYKTVTRNRPRSNVMRSTRLILRLSSFTILLLPEA